MSEINTGNLISLYGKNIRLNIGAWMGGYSAVVFGTGDKKGALMKFKLRPQFLVMFRNCIERVMQGSPGCKESLLFKEWDESTKTSKVIGAWILCKDDKNQYSLECQLNGDTKTFPIRAGAQIQYGSESLSDAERGNIGIKMLLSQLIELQFGRVLSNIKNDYNGGGKQNSYGGSKNTTTSSHSESGSTDNGDSSDFF